MLLLVNKMIETFEEYISARYKNLEKNFLEKTAQDLSENFKSIRKFCIQEWRKAISKAAQEQAEVSCAYMSVSLLNTSIAENTPTLQIDFYNEEWVYGESFSRSKMSADFLFKYWKDFTFNAFDDSYYLRSSFGKVEIQSLFFETADKLAFLFACFAKYFTYQLRYYDEFDELKKAEKFFVTCGTYLDWQNRVFGKLPEIDLLNPADNEQTTFRPIKQKIFRGKSFHDIDMRSCYFEECLFQDFDFANVSLVDSIFLRCRFISTKFTDCKSAGCNFFECYFKDCAFENCSSNPDDVVENNNEYFAQMKLYHCYVLNSKIIDCDFEQLKLIDFHTKE